MKALHLCLLLLLFSIKVHCQSVCPVVSGLTGTVPNISFTASSVRDEERMPYIARISNDTKSWCSEEIQNLESSPWVQVDLGRECLIHSVSVGGDEYLFNEFIVNYFVLYQRENDSSMRFIIDPSTNNAKVFPRSQDSSVQIGAFPSPVSARVVRIMALPGSWNSDHVCIKFEVNGCISQRTPIQDATSPSYLPSFPITSLVSPSLTNIASSSSTAVVLSSYNDYSYSFATEASSSLHRSDHILQTSYSASPMSTHSSIYKRSTPSPSYHFSTIIITRATFSSSSSIIVSSSVTINSNETTATIDSSKLVIIVAASAGAFSGTIVSVGILISVCCLFCFCWRIKNKRREERRKKVLQQQACNSDENIESMDARYNRLTREGNNFNLGGSNSSSGSSNVNDSLTVSQRSIEQSNISNSSHEGSANTPTPRAYDYIRGDYDVPVPRTRGGEGRRYYENSEELIYNVSYQTNFIRTAQNQ